MFRLGHILEKQSNCPTFARFKKYLIMQKNCKHLLLAITIGLVILNSCTDPIDDSSDTTDPEITILGNNPDTCDYGVSYSDPGATATDETDGDLTSSITTDDDLNVYQQGTYSITYSVEDGAGNKASAKRSVFVYNPNQVTVSSIVGSYNVTENCSGNMYDQGAVISVDPDDDENFYIDNFFNGFLDNVHCTINGTNIEIEDQSFANGSYSIEGNGSINVFGSSVLINLTYTYTDNSDNTQQVCSSNYSK